MKYIYSSILTWELLHDWRRSTQKVREITAGFFFHYRVTPLQRSFEGILKGSYFRSLILILMRFKSVGRSFLPYKKKNENPPWILKT
jgi:hypothetical protein